MPLTPRTRSLILRIGSFILGGGLLWLSLRTVDLHAVRTALGKGNYWWLLPLVGVTLLSHWLRAIRWSIMLEALPERAGHSKPVSVWIAFVSIMIGYMANYAGPRLGELIRTGTVSSHEGLKFSAVLGTVVTGRILDLLMLMVAVATLPFIYGSRISELADMLLAPSEAWIADLSTGTVVISAFLVVAGLVALAWMLHSKDKETGKLRSLISSFRHGLLSVLNTGKPGSIILVTIGIWTCYGAMAWLPFLLLGQATPFGIGPVDAWGLMILGAIGMTIPSPGGIGTYHFITINSLELLHSMPQVDATSYALLAHTGQMILYVLVGFAGFLYLGTTAPRHIHAESDEDLKPTDPVSVP